MKDDFKERILGYEKRQQDDSELQRKSSLKEIGDLLASKQEQPIARPVERIEGAFSN